MTLLIAVLVLIVAVAFIVFGGVGGITLVFMLLTLGGGAAVFLYLLRGRRSRIE